MEAGPAGLSWPALSFCPKGGSMARPKGTTKAGLKYLDDNQLKAFFKAVRRTRDADRRLRDDLAFGLALFYGLRVCELAALRVADIDARARQIRIAAAKGGLTKTEDVPPEIWRKLDAWLKRQEKAGPWLFPGRVDGKPVSASRWKAAFKAHAAAAGLPGDFSVHSLRHSCAMALALQGASPIRIRSWLRHRRVSSSERYFEQAQFADTGRRMAGVFKDVL